jgi:hypothetical protein
MGIFGSRKKVYVSSVVYNLAGDEFKRPDYLKTTVVSSTLNNAPSLADSITDSYLDGPGMKFRRFHQWADRTEYNDLIGLVTGSIQTGDSINVPALIAEIPGAASLQSASIAAADYTFWVDQHVLENFPHLVDTSYTADIDGVTNDITITWADGSLTTFTPVDYEELSTYLYAVYFEGLPEIVQPLVTGATIILGGSDVFPDTTGWTELSYTDDGLGEIHGVWERTTYMGLLPGSTQTYSVTETMYQDTVAGVESYRVDTQDTWHAAQSAMKVFIYKQGSGNAVLDDMFLGKSEMNGFYPVIPIRLDNEFLSEDFQPEIYEQARKAYKKATTGKLHKLIEQLEENEDIDDIDYTYIVFGVCLNVLEQASRKYIYRFFEEILNDYTQVGDTEFSGWQSEWSTARESWETWTAWREAQSDSGNPLYGTAEPERLEYPAMPSNVLRVSTDGNEVINYDITIQWNTMSEDFGSGLLKPDAYPDQLWFSKGDASYNEELIWTEDGVDDLGNPLVAHAIAGARINTNPITLNWQVTENSWRRLTIVGLKHRNLIYKNKAVEIDAFEALDDPNESGFIIPLHDGVFRALGLKDGTQMTTACSFLVFNCYEVVKQRWYETGLFRIILVVIIIVIAFYTGYLDPNAVGLLGSHAGVGTAILGAGASAAAVAIVGAIANALAAMVVMQMITAASTALFGEKWGAVVGAILSVIALNVGTAMAGGQSLSSAFSGLLRADNLLQLTSAVGKGYAGYLQAATAEIAAEQQGVLEEYNRAAREIRAAWEQNLGGEGGIIDPMVVTSAFSVFWESQTAFLDRTLMTGSDIAEMSLDMLTNFTDLTLNTDLPT